MKGLARLFTATLGIAICAVPALSSADIDPSAVSFVAPKDIKSSAQGLLTLVIYGFGMWLGSYFVGYIQSRFTAEDGTVNWTGVFLVPSVLTILCAIVLFLTFPRGSIKEVSAMPEGAAVS